MRAAGCSEPERVNDSPDQTHSLQPSAGRRSTGRSPFFPVQSPSLHGCSAGEITSYWFAIPSITD